MIAINNMHPVVRFGMANGLVEFPEFKTKIHQKEALWELANKTLQQGLYTLVLGPRENTLNNTIHYFYLAREDLKNRGKAPDGYFTGPHVLTSQNIGDLIKETEKLIKLLNGGFVEKTVELKRSFAPMISKRNAGKKTMTNPKIDILEAAFTCITTISHLKPAAYTEVAPGKLANTGLIPDLPLFDKLTGQYPMVEFIQLFKYIVLRESGASAYLAESSTKKKFPRPPIFQGNYPNRFRHTEIGAVTVLAALGKWIHEHQNFYAQGSAVLNSLVKQPVYIISYDAIKQESVGHHLVELALSADLHQIVKQLSRVELIGVDNQKKFSSPKWNLFQEAFKRFLRFFNPASWQDFLAFYAIYPIEFFNLFKLYFTMQNSKLNEAILHAVVAYGRNLNLAAYIAAKEEYNSDQKRGMTQMTLNDYKHRILLQLESIIGSAKTGTELIARLNTQIGRFSMRDIDAEAKPFLLEVVSNNIHRDEAKDLIRAFMRLRTTQKASTEEDPFLDDGE